jgi:2-polyprenyl-3-methyl-5-hydroxy-6-metoxy-1,4-benzoquinol methylase
MRRMVTRPQAQSFDRFAVGYHRLGELAANDRIGSWLAGLLPASGRSALDLGCGSGRHSVLLAERFEQVDAVDISLPMIELATARRPRPNITYSTADLQDVAGGGRYDFVLSVLTLHHVPDLHGALTHIKMLVAPGGRLVVADMYESDSPGGFAHRVRGAVRRVVPLRLRLRALAVQALAANIASRGPATAWQIYRLSTRAEWLDHRVSDLFFSTAELERSCEALFPGHRFDTLGGVRGVGLIWDAPPSAAGSSG